MTNMDWVDQQEAKQKEERSKEYFNIEEGPNRFVLLSHCAPMAQRWTGTKYEFAEEGDKNISIKGVCWVLQDDMIKMARLPYTVVKSIRALQNDPEWDFSEFPFNHVITVNAKGAGTKEVEYTTNASPKEITIPAKVLEELKKKPSPEEMIEKLKEKAGVEKSPEPKPKKGYDYPKEEINPDDIPF